MNSQKDPLALPVIKQEFDDDLITPLEGWSPLTGNIATNSSLPLSPTTTQSGENLVSPTETTSNDSTTRTTTPFPNLIKTYPSVGSVHKRPKIDHQVKILKRSNNRPFFANRNKFVPNDSIVLNKNTDLLFNLELQLKQTQEQLKELTVESRNANEILEKKYVELKSDYCEFKTNSNIKLNKLEMENDKLHDEINQLKNHHQTRIDQINAQDTPNQSQLNSIHQQNVNTTIDNLLTTQPVNSTSTVQIKQEIIDDDSTCSEPIQVEQSIDSGSSSLLFGIPSLSEKVSEDILQTENSSGNLNVFNLSNSNDQLSSLTDQNVTESQYIKQEFSDDDSLANRNEKFTVDDISTNVNISSDVNMDEVMTNANELEDENEVNLDQYLDDDEMSNSANDNNPVAKSIDPSTGARRQSNRSASKSPSCSSLQNFPKRKQSQPNRTAKKSKKTFEDDDDDESLNDEEQEGNQIDDKIKVLYLDCTEQNCKIKLNSLKHLNDHLSSAHELLPFQCFEQNCNLRFDMSNIRTHLKLYHTNPNSKFVCPVCRKEIASQQRTYIHWNQNHMSGQFQCNLNECNLVYDTRAKLYSHQRYKHCPQSKLFICQHDGCSLTFSIKRDFERHQLVHLNSKSFHCKWPQCNHRTNRRADLVIHIRVRHFGLPRTVKEQKEKNIVEERDPNDFVRVVEDDDEDTE